MLCHGNVWAFRNQHAYYSCLKQLGPNYHQLKKKKNNFKFYSEPRKDQFYFVLQEITSRCWNQRSPSNKQSAVNVEHVRLRVQRTSSSTGSGSNRTARVRATELQQVRTHQTRCTCRDQDQVYFLKRGLRVQNGTKKKKSPKDKKVSGPEESRRLTVTHSVLERVTHQELGQPSDGNSVSINATNTESEQQPATARTGTKFCSDPTPSLLAHP